MRIQVLPTIQIRLSYGCYINHIRPSRFAPKRGAAAIRKVRFIFAHCGGIVSSAVNEAALD